MKQQLSLIIRIGFAYIGTVVGAGFASGQEIFQFFTVFGQQGIWGILFSVLLFSWLGTRMMLMGARLKASSYQEFNYYLFGERFGRWMNGFVGIILFGVITAMLSGTGALAKEQLGFSFHWGVIITSVLAFLVIIRGMEGILSINSLVVPLMFFFLIVIGITCLNHAGTSLFHYTLINEGNWLLSSITYVAFNLAMSQAVLVPLGAEIKDEKVLRWGGWFGGLGLGFMLIVSYFAMQMHFSDVQNLQIPMAFIIHTLGIGMKIFFLAVMWGEIFTTLVGNIYGLALTMRQIIPLRLSVIIALIFFTGYLCSLVGFPLLISYLYPAFGYCGIIVLILLIIRKIPRT